MCYFIDYNHNFSSHKSALVSPVLFTFHILFDMLFSRLPRPRRLTPDRAKFTTIFSFPLSTFPNHRRRPLHTTSSIRGRVSTTVISSLGMCSSLDTTISDHDVR